ncbi:MAG: DNA polymerase beta domain-containing protein [Geobacteraceae bacterium]|nr:MAG: DNA polymerase beta domain-containing protein [Geobacteraceae bacterium]
MKAAEITEDRKEALLARIRGCLEKRLDIVFAYVHGSFALHESFNDIDIAVFFDSAPDSPLQIELLLEAELGNAVRDFPVDVRVLNNSPLSFRYNVIRFGRPLFINDDDIRSDFVEAAIRNYLDFAPFRRMYLKETLGLAI